MAKIADELLTRKDAAQTVPNLHLIVFQLGGEDYGIHIEQVKEVTVTPEITRMPKTPTFIKGVANIRGDIVAIMDLVDRFSLHVPDDGVSSKKRQTYTLVIEAENYTVGIMVPNVPQSLTIPVSQLDKTPNLIAELNISEKFIDGIGKYEGRLIIVLDIQKILTHQEMDVLASI